MERDAGNAVGNDVTSHIEKYVEDPHDAVHADCDSQWDTYSHTNGVANGNAIRVTDSDNNVHKDRIQVRQ